MPVHCLKAPYHTPPFFDYRIDPSEPSMHPQRVPRGATAVSGVRRRHGGELGRYLRCPPHHTLRSLSSLLFHSPANHHLAYLFTAELLLSYSSENLPYRVR